MFLPAMVKKTKLINFKLSNHVTTFSAPPACFAISLFPHRFSRRWALSSTLKADAVIKQSLKQDYKVFALRFIPLNSGMIFNPLDIKLFIKKSVLKESAP